MNVKRFVAKDMQEAFKNIKKELGSDAIILNNRYIQQKGMFSKPLLEVFAAYDGEKSGKEQSGEVYDMSAAQQDIDYMFGQSNSEKARSLDFQSNDLSNLENKIDNLSRMILSFNEKINSFGSSFDHRFSGEIEEIYNILIENDVCQQAANAVAQKTDIIVSKYGSDPFEVASQVIYTFLGEPYTIKPKRGENLKILFVGTTGVGKTTTIAKLAAHFKNQFGLNVGLVSADSQRVGAFEQLKIYADILNVPICSVYSNSELDLVMSRFEDMDVVLIDTPGAVPGHEGYQNEIKEIMGICKCDEIMLSISASTGWSTCKKIIDSFAFLPDYKLIITKLDEAGKEGGILNIKYYSPKPVAYLTNSPDVPDNIGILSPNEVAAKLLNK